MFWRSLYVCMQCEETTGYKHHILKKYNKKHIFKPKKSALNENLFIFLKKNLFTGLLQSCSLLKLHPYKLAFICLHFFLRLTS